MNATGRRAEAIWIESRKLWVIKVQRDGERKSFSSSTPGRKGKRKAEALADEWLISGKSDMPFQLAWEQFLDYQMSHNGRVNYRNYESLGRIYLLPNIKATAISRIRPMQWQKCIDKAIESGLSQRTCKNICDTITAFYKFADRMRWKTIELKKGDLDIGKAKPRQEKKILQPDELRILMSRSTVVKNKKEIEAFYIHAWRILVLTGLRRGELCGLQWDDVTDDTFHLQRSINLLGDITNGKNENARRDVPLSGMALRELEAHKRMLDAMGIHSKWVFPDEWGEVTDPNRLYMQWKYFCRTHGITSSLHEMRHTYISVMKNDMPEQMLKDLVGHSVDMDTFGVYGHVVKPEMQRAREIMDSTFTRLLGDIPVDDDRPLPPQVGKVAHGHVDTHHTDAIKAKEKRPRMPEKKGKRGRPRKIV